jgi:hypothetical protein
MEKKINCWIKNAIYLALGHSALPSKKDPEKKIISIFVGLFTLLDPYPYFQCGFGSEYSRPKCGSGSATMIVLYENMFFVMRPYDVSFLSVNCPCFFFSVAWI